MANHGYMTINGKAQGLISAGCSTQGSIGNKYQAEHTDEIMVLSYSHNMTNIGNINSATHSPIIITKVVDKSSPLLAQALSNREEINCTISFYRVSSFGIQALLQEQRDLLIQSQAVTRNAQGAMTARRLVSLNTAQKIHFVIGLINFGGLFIFISTTLYLAYTKMDFMFHHLRNYPAIINRGDLRN